MLESGKKIQNYVLVRKLGAGGFGEVWQAEKHTKLSVSNFALKFFRPKEGDQINLDKEKREIEIWQKVSGLPNIISIIEADEFEEYIYVVSEFADGGSLEKQMTANGGRAFPLDQAVTITLEILSGLNSLHQMSFVHRDIKPANILIRRGVHCLADFGISREMKAHSKATQTAGTYEYMAPESFENKPVTIHTDIWAVGAIFQQLLTGSLPFPQREIPSLIYAILHGEPGNLPEHIPAGIRKVVATALHKDPQHRFGSAAEMMSALKHQQMLLLNPEPVNNASQETLVWENNLQTQSVESARRNPISESPAVTRFTQEPYHPMPTESVKQFSGNFNLPANTTSNKKSNRSLIFGLVGGGGLLILLLAVGALAFVFKDRIFTTAPVSNSNISTVSTGNTDSNSVNKEPVKNTNEKTETISQKPETEKTETSGTSEKAPVDNPTVTTIQSPKTPQPEVQKQPVQIVKQKPTPPPVVKKRDTPKQDGKNPDSKCIYTGNC